MFLGSDLLFRYSSTNISKLISVRGHFCIHEKHVFFSFLYNSMLGLI